MSRYSRGSGFPPALSRTIISMQSESRNGPAPFIDGIAWRKALVSAAQVRHLHPRIVAQLCQFGRPVPASTTPVLEHVAVVGHTERGGHPLLDSRTRRLRRLSERSIDAEQPVPPGSAPRPSRARRAALPRDSARPRAAIAEHPPLPRQGAGQLGCATRQSRRGTGRARARGRPRTSPRGRLPVKPGKAPSVRLSVTVMVAMPR